MMRIDGKKPLKERVSLKKINFQSKKPIKRKVVYPKDMTDYYNI